MPNRRKHVDGIRDEAEFVERIGDGLLPLDSSVGHVRSVGGERKSLSSFGERLHYAALGIAGTC